MWMGQQICKYCYVLMQKSQKGKSLPIDQASEIRASPPRLKRQQSQAGLQLLHMPYRKHMPYASESLIPRGRNVAEPRSERSLKQTTGGASDDGGAERASYRGGGAGEGTMRSSGRDYGDGGRTRWNTRASRAAWEDMTTVRRWQRRATRWGCAAMHPPNTTTLFRAL